MRSSRELPQRMAEGIAARIERRRFLRKSAQVMFVVTAGVAAGGGLEVIRAPSAFACDCNDSSCTKGAGCPTGGIYGLHPCGPSPCCSSLSSSCDCGADGSCKSGGNCLGKQTNVYSSGCWSCAVGMNNCVYTTTCCDCGVKAACGTPYGRCISWYLSTHC
jgi:hypothetical protein